MLNFCLFGAGRIGKMHARNIVDNPRAQLRTVVDVVPEAARSVAERYGARATTSVEEALADPGIDAVFIASATNTHVDLIGASARAGKAVLCEKPIDLDINRVDPLLDELRGLSVPVMIGFNRRFDPTHAAVRRAVQAGEVGDVHIVVITSRDPSPAGRDYIAVSGGIFRDMTIHDFDLARFLLDEEPVEVFAAGSVLVDAMFTEFGDVDTAMVVMRTASGKLCHINNSRRSVYGYDQRVEVFGSKGMVQSGNQRATAMRRFSAAFTEQQDPLLDFFIERYHQSYVDELNAFIDAVRDGTTPPVTAEDGRRALLLADAAFESLRTGGTVSLRV